MQTFAQQVGAFRPMLMRVARKRLRNEAWAEDAVSEVLVGALQSPQSFGGRSTMGTWLVGILNFKLVDEIRRHTRERQVENGGESPDCDDLPAGTAGDELGFHSRASDPHQNLGRRQFMTQLDRSLGLLPPQRARAFVLRYGLGKDTAEICAELDVSASNLAVILHRARQQLRASLHTQWAPQFAGDGLS